MLAGLFVFPQALVCFEHVYTFIVDILAPMCQYTKWHNSGSGASLGGIPC